MQTTIGVDLHKHQLNTALLDVRGGVKDRRELSTKCRRQIAEYFGSYGREAEVAESVGFYRWFWDLVRPQVGCLHLADPAGVRVHAGRKARTDRNDALLLATLLRDVRLPMAYVPREPVRALRKMVRHRHSIARSLAGERRSLRWLALKNNLPGPETFTSDRAQKCAIVAEIVDITRAKNIDQLSAYPGLASTMSQSGESIHHGHISKQGPPILRWVLQQAAWVAIPTSPQARTFYARISKRAGAKKADTALARKLLSCAWSVCRKNAPLPAAPMEGTNVEI